MEFIHSFGGIKIMPAISVQSDSPVKIMMIGKTGVGKTGALASLVCAGYNLRVLDTDKGIKLLYSLLTDPHYPYAAIIKEKNINIDAAVRYMPIDIPMGIRRVEERRGDDVSFIPMLAPKTGRSWNKAVEILFDWKDEDVNLGSIYTWTEKDVLVIDSVSTLAKMAYYYSQEMNNRLGSREEGRNYQRDIGSAQRFVTRLCETIYSSELKCNVILITHIIRVDESHGLPGHPGINFGDASDDDKTDYKLPEGYPEVIGRALSPTIGKYFNDLYIVKREGLRQTISTVPIEDVGAKKSVWLKNEYPVSSGLAQIFAAHKFQPEPAELIAAIEHKSSGVKPKFFNSKLAAKSASSPQDKVEPTTKSISQPENKSVE
jgi:hypothetical protein